MCFKLLLCLLLLSHIVKAQDEHILKELIESIIEDLPEDIDLSELSERLNFYQQHPINLNRTTAEELKNLFFLSPIQINNFFKHLTEHGLLIDVLELQTIEGFDTRTIQKLLPFVSLSESDLIKKMSLKKLVTTGNHDLLLRYASLIEQQKGFKALNNNRYLGSPEKLMLKYKYYLPNHISTALVLEKDAGEQISLKKPDFLSANISLYNLGKVKKVVFGDYALQFGQGLSLWSGFGFGKSADVTSVVKREVGLKPYSSTNEYSFFRGLATSLSLSKVLDLTVFFSRRKHDASVDFDVEGNKIFSTLNENGYHRTQNEINQQSSIKQDNYGLVLQYKKKTVDMGLIAYQTSFNYPFSQSNQPLYKNFHFTGQKLKNISFYYSHSLKNMYSFGEIAKNISGGFAMINGLLISLAPQVSAVISHRKYTKNYTSFFNQALGEGSGFNEEALYMGLNLSISTKWTISLSADYFKFPWLKFRVHAPSDGYEIMGQLNYQPSKTLKATLSYKNELKQQNTDLEQAINYLDDVKKKSYRLSVNWRLNELLIFQNRLEVVQFKKGLRPSEFGYLIYQDFQYKPMQSKLSANLRLAYFQTDSYNSRIYAYEDDMLYNFSFGMYQGKGLRTYLNLKFKLAKKLDIWARYALFFQPGVNSLGSGLDEIMGQKKSEVKVQVRYQF